MQTFIFLSLFISAITANESKVNPVSEDFLLAKGAVGRTKVGKDAYVYTLYQTYGREAIKLIDRRFEGTFTLGLQVYISNLDIPSFVASLDRRSGEISSISIYDRRFRTAKGTGIGSTLGELRQHYKIGEIYVGEGGGMAVQVPELRMDFLLDLNTDTRPVPIKWWESKDPTLISDDTQIVRVWVKGDW